MTVVIIFSVSFQALVTSNLCTLNDSSEWNSSLILQFFSGHHHAWATMKFTSNYNIHLNVFIVDWLHITHKNNRFNIVGCRHVCMHHCTWWSILCFVIDTLICSFVQFSIFIDENIGSTKWMPLFGFNTTVCIISVCIMCVHLSMCVCFHLCYIWFCRCFYWSIILFFTLSALLSAFSHR